MTHQPSLPQPFQTHDENALTSDMVAARAQVAFLYENQQTRLARLFRHVGDNADDLYLRDLMIRYRGLDRHE